MASDDDRIRQSIEMQEYLAALEALVLTYQHAMVRFCTGMLGADGEDMAQEVFLSAYEAMPRFRRQASIRTWLYSIARHLCHKTIRDRQRRQRRQLQAPDITRALYSTSGSETPSEDAQQLLLRFLQELPERERAILLMRSKHAMSHAEVATVLGISKRTVERKWAEALRYLGGRITHAMGCQRPGSS